MELPPLAQGVPYAEFDSTGLVFGITAPMAAGQGHVSTARWLCYVAICCQYSDTKFAINCFLSTFICTMHAIMQEAPSQK